MNHKPTNTIRSIKPIVIERTFDSPVKYVWEAWTEAEQLKKWWGPRNFSCPRCSIDFRIGGKYLAAMRGEDGREIWSTGKYLEVQPFTKISFTDNFANEDGDIVAAADYGMGDDWPEELQVTLEFEEEHGKTKMRLTHEGIPARMQDECITGWQESLDKLAQVLAAKGRTTL
jgi:uncharacterized protein YndB with AHSA1/START domain